MKTLIKLTLVLCLFGSVALGDGNMPGGNYQCPPEGCPPPPCTVDCGRGIANQSDDQPAGVIVVGTSTDIVIESIKDTLELMF